MYWLRRRWISRFNAISVLKGVIKMRGNPLRDAVVAAERLTIIHKLRGNLSAAVYSITGEMPCSIDAGKLRSTLRVLPQPF